MRFDYLSGGRGKGGVKEVNVKFEFWIHLIRCRRECAVLGSVPAFPPNTRILPSRAVIPPANRAEGAFPVDVLYSSAQEFVAGSNISRSPIDVTSDRVPGRHYPASSRIDQFFPDKHCIFRTAIWNQWKTTHLICHQKRRIFLL